MAQGTMAKFSFVQDLFQVGVYKPSQGKLVRQLTFAAIALGLLVGCWQLLGYMRQSEGGPVQYIVPGGLLLLGGWVAYRLVNFPQFADFLISVEGELNKVSWPGRQEVVRSSIVVIFVIFFLAALLFGFDLIWQSFFQFIDVIQKPAS